MNWFKGGQSKKLPPGFLWELLHDGGRLKPAELLNAVDSDPDTVIGPASQGKSRAVPSLATTTQWAEQLMEPPAPGDGVDVFDAVRPADPYAKQTREVLAALLYTAQVAGVEVDQVQQWARTHSREPGEVLRPHALCWTPKGAQVNPDAHTAYVALTYVQALSEHPRTEIMSRVGAALKRAQNRTTP